MVRKLKTLLENFFLQISHRKYPFYKWYKNFERSQNQIANFNPLQKNTSLLKPFIFAAALLSTILASGIAIGSFFALFFSLLFLYFILTKVFGIQLNFDDVVII